MKKYIFPLLALGLLASCVDDEGNYNYKKLNEVSIQDIAESYAPLAYFDKVTISPVLSGSLAGEDLTNYDYQWHICLNSHSNHIVISDQKDLDWVADVPPGTYTLYFTVKDRATGLEKQQSTILNVGSPYNRGFLVLGENENNQVAMDMISMPLERDTVMIENVFENELGICGAKELIFSGGGQTAEHHQFLWLITNDNAYKLNYGEEFSVIGELSDFDFIEVDAPHEVPMHICDIYPRQVGWYGSGNRGRNYRGFITNDMVLLGMNSASEYYTQPINRYSPSSNEYFKPYPMAFISPRTTYSINSLPGTLFYDMDNQCFANYATSAFGGVAVFYCNKISEIRPGAWPLDLGSQNRTLVYAQNGMNLYSGYAPAYLVFKDEENKYYVAYFSWYVSSFAPFPVYANKSPLYTVDTAVAPDFDRASHYMFSSNRYVVLYSVGNRLYQYDYTAGTCVYHDFDGEITYLEADYGSVGYADAQKDYFVATYDNATGKGMIYKMEVLPTAGAGITFLEGQQWETSIRVKDIEWKMPA